jgi:20S proteasome subunit alpha 2
MGDMNFSLTTFNKTGKLLQIEYALNRVQQGKMSLGIKGTNQQPQQSHVSSNVV